MQISLINFSIAYVIYLIICIIIGLITNLRWNFISIFLHGILLSFSIAVIAYFTVPYASDDLTRYFYWVDLMDGRGIKFAFSESPFSSTLISNFFIYVVSLIGDKHLLPAITVAIECCCVLYIILNEKLRNNISTRTIISYVLICIGIVSLYISVSGIRFNLAVSIAAVIIYNDFIKNKKGISTMVGYALLPFIHMAAITVVLVRLLAMFKTINKLNILLFIIPISLVFLQPILNSIPIQFIQNIAVKIDMYQGMIIAGQSYKRNIGYILFNLLFYLTLKLIEKYSAQTNSEKMEPGESNYISFMKLYSLFSMGTYFVLRESFYRSSSIIAMLSLPVFVLFKRYRSRKERYLVHIITLLYILSMIIFYVYEYLLYYRNWELLIK